MSLLDTIGNKLITDGVVNGVSGWTISKCYLPNTVNGTNDKVVAIFEYEGFETLPDVTRPNISIHVRSSQFEYDVARTKAQDIITALDNQPLTDFVFLFLKSNIFFGGVDANNRPIAIVNFLTMITR